jgi:HSP20 family molecular chaperone IbpA
MILSSEYLDPSSPITAKVENGLLCINLKKAEKPKQTKVNIS